MDPRFLKWMGETLSLYASNLEAWEKMATVIGVDKSAWAKFGEYLPTVSPPPYSSDKMEEFYREWLSFMGAVPKADLEALERKVEALEEECAKLRQALEMLVQVLSGIRQIPAAMNQWVDLAKTITTVHRVWLENFRRQWKEPDEKEGKKHGRNSKELE